MLQNLSTVVVFFLFYAFINKKYGLNFADIFD